jgi:hypothetical protein
MEFRKRHLCDTCTYSFADCDNGEEGKDFFFGSGIGNDNVYECKKYKTQPKICPILSTAKHLSDYMGTNNNLVLCQLKECSMYDDIEKHCLFTPAKIGG